MLSFLLRLLIVVAWFSAALLLWGLGVRASDRRRGRDARRHGRG